MNLRSALSVLAKSSPYAVRTLTHRPADEYAGHKKWLYIKQPIEEKFEALLGELHPGDIVCLCGSSGDGKSEILVRSYDAYHDRFKFHLDATHSRLPEQTAIEALDEILDEVGATKQPLILGVNVGMLANYEKGGAERHAPFRNAIARFVAKLPDEPPYHFLDFERFPKFEFVDGPTSHSPFVKELMRRLTADEAGNPFLPLARTEASDESDAQLLANYKLLGRSEVQDAIIAYLFKARLSKEQFITARSLLDFLHHLLTGPGTLADNLFSGSDGDNDLIDRVAEFDPVLRHSKDLDDFVLLRHLGKEDPKLDAFLDVLAAEGVIHWEHQHQDPSTLIRLFSLLEHAEIGNGYHRELGLGAGEGTLEEYARVWALHARFDGSTPAKAELRRRFYVTLMNAVFNYANRNAPPVVPGEIFLGERGGVLLAAPVDLKPDFARLHEDRGVTASRFSAYLQVGDHKLDPIPINLNFFELVEKLHQGYRPSKYDKSSVVFLDEAAARIAAHASRSKSLKLYDGLSSYTARHEDGMIQVIAGGR